jgi:hypothetical protein
MKQQGGWDILKTYNKWKSLRTAAYKHLAREKKAEEEKKDELIVALVN